MFNQTQIKNIYFICVFILGHMKGNLLHISRT